MKQFTDPLEYHRSGRPGKLEVVPTKPFETQQDLSLAYTPGVAEPCLEIAEDKDRVYEYTAKGNLVAVVSNGTAVLGLGAIGPEAGKPVMEGKAILFKKFADIDVFDLEIDSRDPEEIIRTVKLLEPTFGGINLEDIKAPECFHIEEALKEQMDIPVFHDDQHGTAIISGAALLNALEITGKKIDEIKVVVNGAGAAGIACARFYIQLGVKLENITLNDSVGPVYKGRKEHMDPYKEALATDTDARSLAELMKDADAFMGVSVGNVVTQDMVRSMADNPIVFAMANPDPEIPYADAKASRDDAIVATGRSDHPNQVNNVLGFPFIFRGALDVRARAINEEMKVAAAKALAELAKDPVPYQVMKAYRLDRLHFGREYLIPKPFDPRILVAEASAVAAAAIESGVARRKIDIEAYRDELEDRIGLSRRVMRVTITKARKDPKRVVFPEGEHVPILKACEVILDEGMAHPILLGSEKKIKSLVEENNINLEGGVEYVHPRKSANYEQYVAELFEMRKRKGVTQREAYKIMAGHNQYGAMMVHLGDADAMVSGLTSQYQYTIRPALQIIGARPGVHKVAGMYMAVFKDRTIFFADTTVNIEPTAEDVAQTAILCADSVGRFGVEPRVALVSFSNFGSTRHPESKKMAEALRMVKERRPDIDIDGEMQADTAVDPAIIEESFPFSTLRGGANILIFPNIDAGNAAAKLMQTLSPAEVVGPILLGMNKPVHLLQYGGFDETDVINMTAIAVAEAQENHGRE